MSVLFKRILVYVHKVLGLLLSLLFLMWFTSGIVMIYHSFPRASQQDGIRARQVLTDSLPAVETILACVPDSIRLQSLSIEMYLDRPVALLQGKDFRQTLYLDTFKPMAEKPDWTTIDRLARQWCDAPVARIDSLWKVDQWIPHGRLKSEFPIYKYFFDDPEKHELYISSQSGRILQFTDKNSRFWAWLGAIPHWVYFTTLRQNQPLWINFVKWTSGIGCIMVLVGMILGIYYTVRNRRKGISPYKKKWFRWHHISGLFFGLFAITFAFSGLMSLTSLPDWMQRKPQAQQPQQAQELPTRPPRGGGRPAGMPPIGAFRLDYHDALASVENPKGIRWANWEKYPYYEIITDEGNTLIDARQTEEITVIRLTESMVRESVTAMHGPDAAYTLELIHEYDKDYFGKAKRNLPLPVYRVIMHDDEMHTRYYYNPETLSRQTVNYNSRVKRFLYQGLHSLQIKFLTDRPVLWNIVMYTLLIGGTFLSLTGVVLSARWLVRKIKKGFRKLKLK